MTGRSPRTMSRAEYVISWIRKHKAIALAAFAALGVAVILGVLFFRREGIDQPSQTAQTVKPDASYEQQIKMTPFPINGAVGGAAISPDGKYVVYQIVNAAKGESSVFVRYLQTKSDVQIIPPSK